MTYADRSLAKPASLKTNRWPKHSIVQLARSDTPILREVERVGCVLALPLSGGLHHRYARVRNVRQGRRPSFHGLNKKLPNGPPIARSNLAVPAMRHVPGAKSPLRRLTSAMRCSDTTMLRVNSSFGWQFV